MHFVLTVDNYVAKYINVKFHKFNYGFKSSYYFLLIIATPKIMVLQLQCNNMKDNGLCAINSKKKILIDVIWQ